MKKISRYTQLLEDDNQCIERLLKKWKPSVFGLSEKQYEQELQSWLQVQLLDVPIVAQYGIAKGKADLVIQDSHVIELKLAFESDSVAEFDRCIGQMERYKQKWVNKDVGPVYLVVVGESDTEFRNLLHTWFKEVNDKLTDEFFGKPKFYLIEKRPN
ncbi:MAG: hypothetical protein SFU85_12200 [Candidatus Methylacidiphilales bacterium]|nr:hypothetical protein [Candidatus Methylacidiphilales bacterium]